MYQLSRILIQHSNNLNNHLDGNENTGILIILGLSLIFISYYISNKEIDNKEKGNEDIVNEDIID
jgi:hypothetical protein